MTNPNVPPLSRKRICIDFDGTIVPWGELDMEHTKAFDGAREVMHWLKDAGFEIVILTSRMSPTWWFEDKVDAFEQYEFVAGTLKRLDIPYDRITSEKVPATYYFDDRALTCWAGNESGAWLMLQDIISDELVMEDMYRIGEEVA